MYRQKYITKRNHEFMNTLTARALVAFALAVVVYVPCYELSKSFAPVDYIAQSFKEVTTNKAQAQSIVPERAVENDLTWRLWTLTGQDWDLFADIYEVITCESHWIAGQSNLYYKNTRIREKSFGIAQIHLPDHPEISKEQAMEEVFSLDFIVNEFKAGRACKWSCYKKLFNSCN